MRTCVYPGSFDPLTLGHLDLICRAHDIFDEVIVAVLVNASKKPVFSVQERMEMIRDAVTGLEHVTVDAFDGLLVDYAKSKKASVILRGLRAVSDFEYELQIATLNNEMAPDVETLFMMSQPQYSFLSSSIVREVGSYGRDLRPFVPSQIVDRVSQRLRK